MPQVTFVLKEPNSKKTTLIYLIFRFNNCKLKYSTSLKIDPKLWNSEKQRVKEHKTFQEHIEFNFLLDKLKESVNNIYRNLLVNDITPTPEILREKLNQSLKKDNSGSKDLADFIDNVIESSNRKAGTKRAIKQTIRILREFKRKTGKSLHLDNIDLEFYDKYIEFAKNKGYRLNTIGTHIKNIKIFMREAFERGLTKNMHFRSKRFKKLDENSQKIYLSLNELEALFNFNLSNNPRLDRVKDLFIVGCYTGLRFSDLTKLMVENINKEKRVIKIKTQKTGEPVIIPINKMVNAIIDKYKGLLPTAISNEKMNAYIKELGKLVGLDEEVEIVYTVNGQNVRKVFKKYELITTHTARRSFATNAYLMGIPSISIMKITGHKTEKSFLQYIKISQEDNANKLTDHPFFA